MNKKEIKRIIRWKKITLVDYPLDVPVVSLRKLEKLTGFTYSHLGKIFNGLPISEKTASLLIKKIQLLTNSKE